MWQQAEADRLAALPKQMLVAQLITPGPGNGQTWPAQAADRTANVLIDMRPGQIISGKLTLQERYQRVGVLGGAANGPSP